MRALIQDFRFRIRQLHRSRGFVFVAVLTNALGIGVTAVMFSVVNAVLLHPLPFQQSEGLVAIGEFDSRHSAPQNGLGSIFYLDVADIRTRNRSFTDVAAYHWNESTVTGLGRAFTCQSCTCKCGYLLDPWRATGGQTRSRGRVETALV